MSATSRSIRVATPSDAAELLETYAPFVEETSVSFETVVPSVEEFAARIVKSNSRWVWLVSVIEGRIAGYAYGSSHRERAAYRWSVEVSAYVHRDFHGLGVGRELYEELFRRLEAMGYCNAFAGITLPNPASVAFHESLGFERIGVFQRIGWKFGTWHDVVWYQRRLRDTPPEE